MPKGSRPGERRGGRKKGTPNKVTATIKEALTTAFEKLGGTQSLVSWGQANPTEFYKLWGKLAPHDVQISTPKPVAVHFTRQS